MKLFIGHKRLMSRASEVGECGVMYGTGGRPDGTSRCRRPQGHPPVSEDGVGHSPQVTAADVQARKAGGQVVVEAADGAPIQIEGCPFEVTWKDGVLRVRNGSGIGGMSIVPDSGVEVRIVATDFEEFRPN